MKSAAEIAEELHTKIGHLTKEAQTEVAGALYGQRTIRTALRLMEEGAEGVERQLAKNAAVSASDMAATRLDTLEGSANLLRAAVESLGIAIGDSGLKQWARDLVDAAAEMARQLATTNPEILRWGTIMAGVAAAIGPAILAAGLFAAAVGAIGIPIAATVAAIGLVIGTVVAFWTEIQTAARMVANAFKQIYETAKAWLMDKLQPVFAWLQSFVDGIGKAFR
jgi:phage-related minor tail protein